MALQMYEKGALFMDGVLLAEIGEFSIEHDAKVVEIETMQKGFAGISPGAARTSVDLSSMVPRKGMEKDYITAVQQNTIVELTAFRAGQKGTCKGFLVKASEKYGVNQAAGISTSFIGEPMNFTTL